MTRPQIRIVFLLSLTLFVASLPAVGTAATIVSQGNSYLYDGGVEISVDEALDVSWTSANSYSNVAISVLLGANADIPEPGLAYLTTSIGSGTTAANEIASTNFTYSVGGSDLTIFTGLTLGPGTYYLTLYSPSLPGGAWLFASNPAQVTGAGSSIGQSSFSYHPVFDVIGPYAYAPALPFLLDQVNEQLIFSVTGDPVSTATPEPASWALFTLGLVLTLFYVALHSEQGQILRR